MDARLGLTVALFWRSFVFGSANELKGCNRLERGLEGGQDTGGRQRTNKKIPRILPPGACVSQGLLLLVGSGGAGGKQGGGGGGRRPK